MNKHPLVTIATDAARKAGNMMLRSIDRLESIKVNTKSRHDYASEVDRTSEDIIIKTIRKSYPDHAIIGEETGAHTGKDKEICWIIDPLDGTTNYIHGLPHYAISIAIQVKEKIEHGVIYDPIRQEMFIASRGAGSYVNNRRIRVSPQLKMENAILATGFPFRQRQHFPAYLKSLSAVIEAAEDIRRAGSAALDLAYVAAGRVDGFWEIGLSQWDIAAGSILIKEAGGRVSDFKGGEDYLNSGNIVAGNPRIFKGLLQTLHASKLIL